MVLSSFDSADDSRAAPLRTPPPPPAANSDLNFKSGRRYTEAVAAPPPAPLVEFVLQWQRCTQRCKEAVRRRTDSEVALGEQRFASARERLFESGSSGAPAETSPSESLLAFEEAAQRQALLCATRTKREAQLSRQCREICLQELAPTLPEST